MKHSIFSFALSVLLVNSTTTSLATPILNSDTDKYALISFKNSITSDPYAIFTNWSHNTSVCNWIGVSCGVKHQRVTDLSLSGFDLVGTVAPHLGNLTFLRYLNISFNNFTGFLPFEISKLHRLKVMDVGVNSFSGEIPTWLGNLPQLEQLAVFKNTFSGRIPSSLSNCTKLQVLHMSYNVLSGSIPHAIFNMSSLRQIRLGYNKLIGGLPNDMCHNLPNLNKLTLSGNQLSGEIPRTIWECKELEILSLSYNHFSGSIPSEIGRLSKLRELYLGINDLQGVLPQELGNLSNLEMLSIPDSSLVRSIPSSIFNLSSLEDLDLSNNSLSGTVPTLYNLPKLEELHLSKNKLTGELPQDIGTLPSLKVLSVFNNSLSGSIPSSISNISTLERLTLSLNEFSGNLPPHFGNSLSNLERLSMTKNELDGHIPTSITNASKLIILDMNANSFSGSIPNFGNLRLLKHLSIGTNNLSGFESSTDHELTFLSSLTNCRFLTTLVVSNNPLYGILPSSIGNFSTSLEYFVASNNNILGVIPPEIGNLSSLLYIFLVGNQLSGPIPPTIGKMKQLQKLYLNENQLVGFFPHELCVMKKLGELYIGHNMLVGPIPECLGEEVKSLRAIDLSSNQLNSTIPPKFWTLTDLLSLNLFSNHVSGQLSSQIGNLKALEYLDLSSNQFSGDIPNLIDGCQSLEFINFSNNHFNGSIPESFGNVKGLATMDLSYNNLSGSIPKSLQDLHFLEYFNVSYNKLEGEIPDGGHFSNFNAQSFSSNSALCGPMRFKVPPCSKNRHGSRLKRIMMPSVISAVFMMIVIIVLLKTRKKKRDPLPTDISPVGEWRRISYMELERGTSGFSETNLLGRGSYGSIFVGTLSDGLKVAIKVFTLQLHGAMRSFGTETEIMSSIRHRNLVRLIGCCSNTEFKALIMTYMPNGSLDKWLYSNMHSLDLLQRLKIVIDVASALEYLHHGYTFPIVHCDVKPNNVLLDEHMTAHLADFGIAKLFEGGEEFIQTQTLATIGYAAPELGLEGKVSTNGDVYSFGIMLLEMFTGKKPTDDMFDGELSLKEWASEALEENAATEIVAPALLSSDDRHFSVKMQCVSSVFELAMKCLSDSADERINMIEAVAALQKINATIVAETERRRPRYTLSVTISEIDGA